MSKILAFLMAGVQAIMLLFGMCSSEGYQKLSGLKEALSALSNKNEIIQSQYVGEVSTESYNGEEFTLDDAVILKKEKGKDFVILNLSDTHFSDYDERAFFAFEGSATIRRLVASVKPDLITVTGDIVCGDSTVYAVKRFTDLMESFGIPWAPVFGNHDAETNCDANYLADIMLTSPNCLLKKGDPEMGVGNYVIAIAEENEDGAQNIVEALVMMDSHRSQPNEKQKEWYSDAAAGINKLSGGKAEISLFMHIPLPEYQYAYDLAWDNEANAWRDGYNAYGAKYEEICCEKADGVPVQRGFFDAVKRTGNTKYIFCGHEHMNNFSVEYEGVRLTYTMKLGYGSGYQIGFNGGTVITVGNSGIEKIVHRTYSALIPIDIVKIDTTV